MTETAPQPPPTPDAAPKPAVIAQTGPMARWLKDCGIDDDAEGTIVTLLVEQAGGDEVSLLANITEAPLLLAAGKHGLRGIKLRKLLAVLPGVMKKLEPTEADVSASATGEVPKPDHGTSVAGSVLGSAPPPPQKSAFDALVASAGPPPPSPRGAPPRQPLPIVTTPPSTPPPAALVTKGAALSLPVAPHAGGGDDSPPIFTERTKAAISHLSAQGVDASQVTPRTFDALRVAAAADSAELSDAAEAADLKGASTPLPLALNTTNKPLALATPLPSSEPGAQDALITERTADALRKLGDDCRTDGEAVDVSAITPRTVAAVKASAQAMEDEKLAMSLQAALDEEASAAVASEVLKQAKANPTKGKPSARPKKAKASPKGGAGTAGAGAAAGKAAGSTRKAKPADSARFRIDIGMMTIELEIDKKILSKPLFETVVRPTLLGYLSDKPACVREPLSAHPEDVVVSVEGEPVDGKSSSKSYVLGGAEYTSVALLLPQWATDVLTRAPAAMAEILGTQHSARDVSSVSAHAGGLTTTTITTVSAPFHVNIASGGGAGLHNGRRSLETITHLNATWLAKPLRQALIGPALQAYAQSNPNAPHVELVNVTVAVDGKPVSGAEIASTFVRPDGSPAEVDICLPMDLEIRAG